MIVHDRFYSYSISYPLNIPSVNNFKTCSVSSASTHDFCMLCEMMYCSTLISDGDPMQDHVVISSHLTAITEQIKHSLFLSFSLYSTRSFMSMMAGLFVTCMLTITNI